ncbi:MAG: alkaline phosphatase [Candidatus Cloacimonetes bacterium]|nr:alkaline phosphatase [Candidatus Cloacimonadota bacterium]
MIRKILLFLLLSTAGCLYCQNVKSPRNIILMISDGCGYNQIEITDLYQHGFTGSQSYESFPVRLAVSTYPADTPGYDPARIWSDFHAAEEYWTDSAAAATALATGYKTRNGFLGKSPEGMDFLNITEVAENCKKSTGVVTSVHFTSATPAAFIVHHSNRYDYEDIALQMLVKSSVDVIMGCGHPWYDNDGIKRETARSFKYVGGEAVWHGMRQGSTELDLDGDGTWDTALADADHDGIPDPWFLIETREEFLYCCRDSIPKRLLGIPLIYNTLQYSRLGESRHPFDVPLNENVPTLAEMSNIALQVLSFNEKGFFLMIEGGAVDKACHHNNTCRLIEEEIDFNLAVEAVIAWIEKNSSWEETLLIVTADHECGYLTGPDSGEPGNSTVNSIKGEGRGRIPVHEWHSGSHTNMLVPLFAKGQGAEFLSRRAVKTDPCYGEYLDNTDIGDLLIQFWK